MTLIVSCLCHDIDHRGTTNAFQLQTGSTLASLYSSEGSVMERHHFSQTLLILNTKVFCYTCKIVIICLNFVGLQLFGVAG